MKDPMEEKQHEKKTSTMENQSSQSKKRRTLSPPKLLPVSVSLNKDKLQQMDGAVGTDFSIS